MRAARSQLCEVVHEIADLFQPQDFMGIQLCNVLYELNFFPSKTTQLTATNQNPQSLFCTRVSQEEDITNISVKDVQDIGVEQVLGLRTWLIEALCQVNHRNQGKSGFVSGPGYIGTKRDNNVYYQTQLMEMFEALYRANTVNHYFTKLAKVEKYNFE